MFGLSKKITYAGCKEVSYMRAAIFGLYVTLLSTTAFSQNEPDFDVGDFTLYMKPDEALKLARTQLITHFEIRRELDYRKSREMKFSKSIITGW